MMKYKKDNGYKLMVKGAFEFTPNKKIQFVINTQTQSNNS